MRIEDIRIGASEVGAAMGVDPYRTPAQLWARKLGIDDGPDEGSMATAMGTALEDGIVRLFAERHEVEPRRWDSELSRSRPWLRATPDRVILWDDMTPSFRTRFGVEDGEALCLEIKTTALTSYIPGDRLRRDWGAEGSSVVPPSYGAQGTAQVFVMDEVLREFGAGWCRRCIVKALIPGRGAPEFELRPSPENTADLLGAVEHFVDLLVREEAPDPVDVDDWRLIASLATQKKASDAMIEADDEVVRAMIDYDAARRAAKQAEEAKARARAILAARVGTDYGFTAPIGRVTFSASSEKPVLGIKAMLADLDERAHGDPGLRAVLDKLRKKHTRNVRKQRALRVTIDGDDESDD